MSDQHGEGTHPTDLTSLLELTPHGVDAWVGESAYYPWGRVYGGQVVAQGLRAAGHTVEPDVAVHSVHAYFIRGGSVDEPIRYEVDRIRNGRSFVTRRVVARQSGGAILNLACSFHRHEEAPDVQPFAPPEGPGPDAGVDRTWTPMDGVDRTWTPIFEHVEVPLGDLPRRARSWLRLSTDPGPDPQIHACALAYVSDDVPMESIVRTHPDRPPTGGPLPDEWMGASLDHAVWFHAPVRADEWMVMDLETQRLRGNRGLATGRLFDSAGVHVASVAQEGLLRRRR